MFDDGEQGWEDGYGAWLDTLDNNDGVGMCDGGDLIPSPINEDEIPF